MGNLLMRRLGTADEYEHGCPITSLKNCFSQQAVASSTGTISPLRACEAAIEERPLQELGKTAASSVTTGYLNIGDTAVGCWELHALDVARGAAAAKWQREEYGWCAFASANPAVKAIASGSIISRWFRWFPFSFNLPASMTIATAETLGMPAGGPACEC